VQHPTVIRSGITIYSDEFCVRKESFLKYTIFSILTSLICQLQNQPTLNGHFALRDYILFQFFLRKIYPPATLNVSVGKTLSVDIISYHKFTTYFSVRFHHLADSPLKTTTAVMHNLFFNSIQVLKKKKRIKNE
jgi:hypothetical protein